MISDPAAKNCAYSPGIVTSAAEETSLNIPTGNQLFNHGCTDSTVRLHRLLQHRHHTQRKHYEKAYNLSKCSDFALLWITYVHLKEQNQPLHVSCSLLTDINKM
jgi:hypothetical protein